VTAADNQAFPDWSRTIDLPGSQWRATIAIAADGDETLWLMSPHPNQKAGCACGRCAPHEQTSTPDTTRQPEQTT
jgi:hypothetical protein